MGQQQRTPAQREGTLCLLGNGVVAGGGAVVLLLLA